MCECLSCLLCENWWRSSCGWEPGLGAILFLCLLGSFLGCIRETHTTQKERHDDDVITIGLNYGGCSLWHAPLRLLFHFPSLSLWIMERRRRRAVRRMRRRRRRTKRKNEIPLKTFSSPFYLFIFILFVKPPQSCVLLYLLLFQCV